MCHSCSRSGVFKDNKGVIARVNLVLSFRVDQRTGGSPNDIENLAAAHAECGNFKEAVQWEKKAIELGVAKHEAENARRRLKRYEEGKPWREK